MFKRSYCSVDGYKLLNFNLNLFLSESLFKNICIPSIINNTLTVFFF